MENIKKISIILVIAIIVCSIVLIITLNIVNKIEDGLEQEPELFDTIETQKITSNIGYESSCEEKIMKFIYYFGLGYEGSVNVICPEKTYDIPKAIENMEIKEIYKVENAVNEVYYIDLYLNNNSFPYIIVVDGVTSSYKLIETKKMTDMVEIDSVLQKYLEYKEIPNKIYNNLEFTEDMKVHFYFNNFIYLLDDNVKTAYSFIDEEYRNKKLQNEEEFNSYLVKNGETIKSDYITKAQKEKEDNGYTIYKCEGLYGFNYIIKIKNSLDYSIQLDDYTVETEENTNDYLKLSSKNKGTINVKKFLKMINTGDYSTAYNLLHDGFKQTYFPTEQEFEDYIKNRLFKYNIIKSGKYKEIANLHVYTLNLKDATEESEETKEFNIIMKLSNDTSFTISFEVD